MNYLLFIQSMLYATPAVSRETAYQTTLERENRLVCVYKRNSFKYRNFKRKGWKVLILSDGVCFYRSVK